jgi:hypothetical protein
MEALMKSLFFKVIVFSLATIFFVSLTARAQSLDQIGVTLLRATTTNLNGAGIRVAQAEASAPAFEVNPAAVNQPVSLFAYLSSTGSSSTFPNSVGTESGHADGVGGYFYGLPGGVATNVIHVDNYDADHFFNDLISATFPASINAPVANQSFIFCNSDYSHFPVGTEQSIDSQYDDYAAQFKTLFISGAGNGGPTNQARVFPAATCYNGLGVAAYGGNSCIGPTLDNGRCKPDITAPAGVTSFSTPQVAGAAAILMQAALRGDGGSDTNSAFDIRTIKALLLNGAVKPANWTNSNSSPLDARYGAGIVNVFNSYRQLAGGKQSFIAATTVATGGAHPPNGAAATLGVLSGWDNSSITSGKLPTQFDAVNHYYFDVTNNVANGAGHFIATATLVWSRQKNQSAINDLNLFLYDCANSNLVASSASAVDNVEHLYAPRLTPGRYDLQVWKAGGLGIVSAAETYALAWAFAPAPALTITNAGTNLALAWPIYPAGFVVQSAANLTSPNWSTSNLLPPIFTNNQNVIWLNATNAAQFFRLRQP